MLTITTLDRLGFKRRTSYEPNVICPILRVHTYSSLSPVNLIIIIIMYFCSQEAARKQQYKMASSSGARRSVSDDNLCSVCFDQTNYICLICDMPICNKCSVYEYNEETKGWLMGISVGYCMACKKPEAREGESLAKRRIVDEHGATVSSTSRYIIYK